MLFVSPSASPIILYPFAEFWNQFVEVIMHLFNLSCNFGLSSKPWMSLVNFCHASFIMYIYWFNSQFRLATAFKLHSQKLVLLKVF